MGFLINPRKSSRIPPVKITDLCFADDIALLANEIEQAQELITGVENEGAKIGLSINAKKTQAITYNQEDNTVEIKAINGDIIKKVENYKYLGSWVKSSEHDINTRKALAWSACHKLRKVWTSSLKKSMKIRLFVSTVESVLLYDSNTWTITKKIEKQLDGTYTRMLRMALNVSWKQHMTNKILYGTLPKISEKIRANRLRLAAHCVRHEEEEASKVILWQPNRGWVNNGRKPLDFVDLLKSDTGLEDAKELADAMKNRIVWKDIVSLARTGVRPK